MDGSRSKNDRWSCELEDLGGDMAANRVILLENKKKRRRRSMKKLKSRDKCQLRSKINMKIESCGIFNEGKSAAVGGDSEESEKQRSLCHQHELNFPNEINRTDVMSCDFYSNSAGRGERDDVENRNIINDCPRSKVESCSTSHSTCSEGSYSRRKHHKHKEKSKNLAPIDDTGVVSPKVNPIFLWVRQEDTRIVEVLCEDYDHRNRLKLTRTHLGWRAIPKTKRFAEVVLPKPVESENNKSLILAKKIRKVKRGKKVKVEQSLKSIRSTSPQNGNLTEVRSLVQSKDDLDSHKYEDSAFENSSKHRQNGSGSPVIASEGDPKDSLAKSNFCDSPLFTNDLPRTVSLDLKLKQDSCNWKEKIEIAELEKFGISLDFKEVPSNIKIEPGKLTETHENEQNFIEAELEKLDNQRNHSESIVIPMTKQDSDFIDVDSDDLGQLLKDIPDLEFVEEDELREVDEDEWSTPTDLTIPKISDENSASRAKPSSFPVSIAPVTPSIKPTEPMTSFLPEITITPVPKPAHQQRQNNFLESLLSSSDSVKSESSDFKVAESSDRKNVKHLGGSHVQVESKSKKLKVEDITLKNLLSKQRNEKAIKSADVDKRVQNSKAVSKEEYKNSRLEGLLTFHSDPISQLKDVLSNPLLAVPDPLLVPRARLPALVASPASEIPRLLRMHLEKSIEEEPCPPFSDSDMLEVSLSNLQSLLARSPDKSSGVQDLANHQKALETLLEWQRYQSELIGSEINSQLSSNYACDIPTAFTQMLWLPYLNQLDLNGNRNVMSLMNSAWNHECYVSTSNNNNNNLTAPPKINVNQGHQPSPFLTPTSPMDIESRMKTLAMWQEALSFQNSRSIRSCNKDYSTPSQELRRNAKGYFNKKQGPNHQRGISMLSVSREEQNVNQYIKACSSKLIEKKYQNGIVRQSRSFENKVSEPGSISVKPLSNLIDKVAARLQQFNTEIQKTTIKEENSGQWRGEYKDDPSLNELPKLKVKNLVDPNMAPPKLLKQISPEHLPIVMDNGGGIQDDGQGHLWHPLFGSSQIRTQTYNSPWSWTTVTVNGE